MITTDDHYLVNPLADPEQPGITPQERRLRHSEYALAEAFRLATDDYDRAGNLARTAIEHAEHVARDPESPEALVQDAHQVLEGVQDFQNRRRASGRTERLGQYRAASPPPHADGNTLLHKDFPSTPRTALTAPTSSAVTSVAHPRGLKSQAVMER